MGQHDVLIEYARGSCSGRVTSSPTMVWITPIFPLSKPPTARPARAIQRFDAKPTTIMLNMVPKHPTRSTGFRPIRSDKEPQKMPHESLRQGEGGYEQARVEGGIILAADFEPLHQCPSIWVDGRQSNWLGETNDS